MTTGFLLTTFSPFCSGHQVFVPARRAHLARVTLEAEGPQRRPAGRAEIPAAAATRDPDGVRHRLADFAIEFGQRLGARLEAPRLAATEALDERHHVARLDLGGRDQREIP